MQLPTCPAGFAYAMVPIQTEDANKNNNGKGQQKGTHKDSG